MNRLCLAYEVRGPDIIAALGLNTCGEMRPSTMALALSPPSIEALGAATGFSKQAIEEMLLSRFTATALPNLPRPPYTQRVLPSWSTGAWVLRHHANFCPLCLGRDGRWRLEWKLPWSFACLDHMVYLRNLCPRCGRVQSGLSWGWDSRVCHLMKPQLNTLAEIQAGGPLRKGGRNRMCGGRLDEATTVPVTDAAAIGGQKRLIRWLYGTSDEAAQEREFASLVALAARELTAEMLGDARPEISSAFETVRSRWSLRPTELAQRWTDPLWMAGASHVAQQLSDSGNNPEQAVQWLKLKQNKVLKKQKQRLSGTSLAFGPFHHTTEHMNEALRANLVRLPHQVPAYVNALSPYRVRPVRTSKPLPDLKGN